jgi:3-hexulose-6-phosphate synthase
MKLQLALDGSLRDGLSVLDLVADQVDIAELGTPLLFQEGISAVSTIHTQFPSLALLADLKIVDAGQAEASIAFEAGCDYATVLGIASDATVKGALQAAHTYGSTIMIDMLQVPDPLTRAEKLLALGCQLFCVHTAYDLHTSGATPFTELEQLRQAFPNTALAVAGGIGPSNLLHVLPLQPEIVIVGSAITQAADPRQAAMAIREQIDP